MNKLTYNVHAYSCIYVYIYLQTRSFFQLLLTVERQGPTNGNSETSPIITRSTAADEVDVLVRQEGSSIIT